MTRCLFNLASGTYEVLYVMALSRPGRLVPDPQYVPSGINLGDKLRFRVHRKALLLSSKVNNSMVCCHHDVKPPDACRGFGAKCQSGDVL
ncbi:hypothetical protein SAMN04489759_1071 [Sulfitobacter delicatus]|uniref:Uncharacterized protein n=1 Tax=Sulfitobacter delicatus TaxID=218672 RepID=A0A1G7TMH6_9RHOB|nr:hypothetical protein SAMN04489759_1071 [Sulfitobacter delicatus]